MWKAACLLGAGSAGGALLLQDMGEDFLPWREMEGLGTYGEAPPPVTCTGGRELITVGHVLSSLLRFCSILLCLSKVQVRK